MMAARCAGWVAAMDDLGRWMRALLAAAAVVLCGCAADGPDVAAPQAAVAAGPAAFDREASAHFLAEAQARFSAGDMAGAKDGFEAAALLWPDNLEAWRGLVAVARAQGDRQDEAAAEFVQQRVYLFPTQSLATQREYRVALLTYIDEEEKAADANALQLAYARALADYYAYRYAERGTYQAPELPFFNVRWEDGPAVAVTGILLLVYGFTVAAS